MIEMNELIDKITNMTKEEKYELLDYLKSIISNEFEFNECEINECYKCHSKK